MKSASLQNTARSGEAQPGVQTDTSWKGKTKEGEVVAVELLQMAQDSDKAGAGEDGYIQEAGEAARLVLQQS